MDDTLIVTIFTVIDDVMVAASHRTHPLAHASDSEVLTVAVVAACQFQNHQQRALGVLRGMHYLSGSLSFSRFTRRLHALAPWFTLALDLLCDLFASGAAAFTLDSLPVPVCHRVRATRCTKVQGSVYYGYCAAKKEKFFGWRLHLVCTASGVPVGFDLRPASLHDLNPVYDLAQCLSKVAADEIRSRSTVCVAAGSARPLASVAPLQSGAAQQTRYPFARAIRPLVAQLGPDTRGAKRATTACMHRTNLRGEDRVGLTTCGRRTRLPCVIAALRHADADWSATSLPALPRRCRPRRGPSCGDPVA